MRRIAISGHRELAPEVERRVDRLLRAHLAGAAGGLIGLSCLADGADTLFARAVLDLGGALEVVVPAEEYRDGLPAGHHRVYDALLRRAVLVHRLPYRLSAPESHMAAGRYMVHHCDELVAVWDGEPARGPGGTADVVGYAREQGRRVAVIWPDGAHR
ncbi:hypothetical protein [Marinitenerispora sediminis]|uniref:DNA recombination-mediator protein A n=1 Tax=Marinitenerispora sediminis TaxID=1931232 RepID=A0A368SXS7_9ACTN|nr:hypothetical protein [Marinitenerispora sediminis]RCV47453.1 hypothetical protein DEF28_26235 [Marinitenerispora sediminis]RCV47469.1 hypothetical protein DEF24_27095 [Marinitenerispora sediminis]RCV47641.1 hypothetical protein DEF23_26430 [Marinitenerispora sediminis]